MRWDHDGRLLWECWCIDLADWELVAILVAVEVLGEVVNAADVVDTAESENAAAWVDLIASQVVVADEILAWLVHVKAVWQLLSSQKKRKRVASVIGSMGLSDLNGVVGQVVVHDERQVLTGREEAQDLTVVVEELLLGRNLATAEFLLEVLEHLLVSFGSDWNPGLGESVGGNLLGWRLGLALHLQRVSAKMEKRLNSSPIEVTAQTVYLRRRSLW